MMSRRLAPIALTALDGDEHEIKGFDLGADDYIIKPVSKRIFLARVRSLLRRAEPDAEVPVEYRDDTVTVNFLTHEASVRGQPLHLRPTEFKLLVFLVQNPDRVLGHQELLDRVWGDQTGSLDSLKWYIPSLREKIEDDTRSPRVILTSPRVGYRYCPSGLHHRSN